MYPVGDRREMMLVIARFVSDFLAGGGSKGLA
jgi:hypothetical protein